MTRSHHDQRDGNGWYRIQAQSDGPAQVYLYDSIGWFGITAQDFLHELGAIKGPVDVHLNSPGGDVFDAYAIYNALASRPGVTTVVDSLAASSASVIAMAGEQRLMARTSQMMIHDAWAGYDGGADDMRKMADRLDTVSGQIADVYAMTAGGGADHWRALMRDETWFTPQQALDAGMITGITGTAREAAAPAAVPAGQAPAGAILNAAGDNAGWVQRGGNWVFDPDGDGDDDSGASTDTDHSHWSADGTQLKPVPPNPATGKGGKPMAPGNHAGGGPQSAAVDNSPWDAAKAWANGAAADDPAAFYNGICAGKKAGDPKTQEAHALPYKYTPSSPPNAGGVKAALSRLPQTQGLTNEAEAKTTLEAAMKKVNPDYEPQSSAAGASAANERNGSMTAENDALTIEGRRTRITDILARQQEINAAYPASELPGNVQSEWDQLDAEKRDHRSALASVEARAASLAADPELLATRGDTPRGGDGRPLNGQGNDRSQRGSDPRFHAPAFIQDRGDGIYDIPAVRQEARSAEEMPGLYRRNAMYAIERGRFPNKLISRETAQGNVERVLDTVTDDPTGKLARRILVTGSPDYKRVFGRAMAAGGPAALAGKDGQILALGLDDTGAYAVPFELDPTVILTSNGTENPLRQISRVERITGKEFDLVSSTGATVTRGAEHSVAPDANVTLLQPKVAAEKVSAFAKFSVELEGDWTALQSSMSELIRDAKDVEEATAFTLGNGTAPQAGGIIGTMPSGSNVTGGGTTGTGIAYGDPMKLEGAIPPRFQNGASWIANKITYNTLRTLFAAQAGYATDPWDRPSEGRPAQLFGYPRYDVSDMDTGVTLGKKVLVLGDFAKGFLIVDRVGMSMELVPHVMDATTQRPTGERGYYVFWRNNSVILNGNAFRMLVLP